MKIKHLSLLFTTRGESSYKGKLALRCNVVGQVRYHYLLVGGLRPYNANDWDNKGQSFTGLSDNAQANNAVCKQLLAAVCKLAETGRFADGKALFAAYRNAASIQASTIITFGQWVGCVAKWEQEKANNKSTNYQLYKTLVHKLTASNAATLDGKRLADTPVTNITNAHFKAFGNWIITEQGGKGYRNLMTYFAAAIGKAENRADLFNDKVCRLTYDWRKYDPNKKTNTANANGQRLTATQLTNATANGVAVLTADEIAQVEKFNINRIAYSNISRRNLQLLEVYKDTALLMYYLGCRPADVIQLHWEGNYNVIDNLIVYVPFKLRNRNGQTCVVDLNDNATAYKRNNAKALEIINKYKGQSTGGYILPLPINSTDWGVIDGDKYNQWENKRKATLASINETLQKIAAALNLSVSGKDMTAYVFRHSSITHQIRKGGNWGDVAKRCGTSVAQIEKHYYNPVKK